MKIDSHFERPLHKKNFLKRLGKSLHTIYRTFSTGTMLHVRGVPDQGSRRRSRRPSFFLPHEMMPIRIRLSFELIDFKTKFTSLHWHQANARHAAWVSIPLHCLPFSKILLVVIQSGKRKLSIACLRQKIRAWGKKTMSAKERGCDTLATCPRNSRMPFWLLATWVVCSRSPSSPGQLWIISALY